eukprot:58449_1
MPTLLWIFNLFLFSYAIFAKACEDPNTRYRKSWFDLTDKERSIFTEGFQLIRDNGKLDILTQAHSTDFMGRIHQSSLFLFYHSYLILEMETAIRDLGGKFTCFAMPYYDWTIDHNSEDDPQIFHSGIGGNGDPDNSFCVPNDWGLKRYTTPNLCADDETSPDCCLKRVKSSTQTLYSTYHALQGIKLRNSQDFDNSIRPSHAGLHRFIGAKAVAHMDTGYAMDDPIFPLAHSYMDLMRALWLNCHGYDSIDAESEPIPYNLYHTYCYDNAKDTFDEQTLEMCSKIESFLQIDDELQFVAITAVDWSLVGKGEKMSVRRLFNLEQSFNVKFDLSEYYSSYPQLRTFCSVGGVSDEVELYEESGINPQLSMNINSYLVVFVVILGLLFAAYYKKQPQQKSLLLKSGGDCRYDPIII